MSIKILSCGTSLPKNSVKVDDIFCDIKLDQQYGIANNWMSEKMGIHEIRVSEPGTRPSELAIQAAEKALAEQPDINRDDIGMVLFCGIERDQTEPATAHNVNKELGLSATDVWDTSNACFGFIDGLKTARNAILCGDIKYALVCTGEVQANHIDSFTRQLKAGVPANVARNLLGYFSLGDAGGAVLLGRSEDESGLTTFNNLVYSKHLDKCYYRPRADGEIEGAMHMAKIVFHGFRMQEKLWRETMQKIGWEKFDWLLTHQTGKRNFEQIAGLNVVQPRQMVKTYKKLGNITSATFPVSFEKLLKKYKPKKGDQTLNCFAGSGLVVGQFGYTF